MIGIRNPVPGIRNPRFRMQNSRLFCIPVETGHYLSPGGWRGGGGFWAKQGEI